jgi:hypothetical protein
MEVHTESLSAKFVKRRQLEGSPARCKSRLVGFAREGCKPASGGFRKHENAPGLHLTRNVTSNTHWIYKSMAEIK